MPSRSLSSTLSSRVWWSSFISQARHPRRVAATKGGCDNSLMTKLLGRLILERFSGGLSLLPWRSWWRWRSRWCACFWASQIRCRVIGGSPVTDLKRVQLFRLVAFYNILNEAASGSFETWAGPRIFWSGGTYCTNLNNFQVKTFRTQEISI